MISYIWSELLITAMFEAIDPGFSEKVINLSVVR